MKNRILSFFLAAVMLVGLVPVLANADAVKATETVAGSSIVWKYLDDNTDPAGADNALTGDARLTWTAIDYDDSAWKSAQGPFGSKRGSTAVDTGYTANTLLAGNDGANNYMTYFFRTELEIESAADVVSIDGAVSYDDSMVLYINGTPVVSGGNTDYTYNLEYCGSGTSPIASKSFSITDTSMLVDGTNIIAVELHQDGAISSDSWFDLSSLKITTNELAYSNISVNIGAFYNEMNFVWHFNDSAAGTLYVAKTADLVNGEMPENARTFTAKATAAKNGVDYYNKVTANGLLENTEYSYQIVTDGVKSDIYTFKTGAPTGAFSFIFAGDPQVGQTSVAVDQPLWAGALEKIDDSVIFDDASFMLVAGDHVNWAGNEAHYDAYLDHEFLYNIPTVDVIGNHDSFNNAWKNDEHPTEYKSSIFNQHFILPNEGLKGSNAAADAGGDSWLVYNNVLFINLNTNNTNNATHIAFMEEAIAANPDVSWKVVMFHHSVYSVGYHSADDPIVNLRNALVPAIAELDIDVVLMGHDHVYCRTYMMDGLNPMTDASIYDDANYSSITDPEGILYVTANSASGTKYYSVLDTINPYAAVQNQERIPNISKVYVSDTQFAITTYRLTDMSVVDTFAINRKETAVDSDVVKVKILINAIGEVNRDAIPRIEAARAAYDALSDEQKAQVTNYDVLLAAEAADFDVADVVTLINNIGKLNAGSAAKIEAAREAYDALSDEQKANVTNYSVLLEAEAALAAAFDPTVIVTSGYDAEIGLVYPESGDYVHVSGRDYNTEGVIYSDTTEGKFTSGTSYTISMKIRTMPFIPSTIATSYNASLAVGDLPAIIRVLSPSWSAEYFVKIIMTPEWVTYTAETTDFTGSLYFLGSGGGYGYAPFDVKDLTIVETGTTENLASNTLGAFDGTAGWKTTGTNGTLKTLALETVENDNGYLTVPESDASTAFTFNSEETLAAGKYTVSGDFRLNTIDYNKYTADVAILSADANIANLAMSMDAETTAEINAEDWTTVTFNIDSAEAFKKNDIVFTLDGATPLGVKNLEITLVEEYIPEPVGVAQIGETLYATLAEAIEAAGEDDTIVMLEDVTLSETLTVAPEKKLTIDLAGKIISGVESEASASAVIINRGELTIVDSVGEGKITSKALTPDTDWGDDSEKEYPSYANNTINNYGKLTLVSGTIENATETSGAIYAIDNYQNGEIVINGGTVTSPNATAIRMFYSNGGLTVTDGEINGSYGVIAHQNANSTSFNISGGTFTATADEGYALYVWSQGDRSNVEVTITGGTFDGDVLFGGGSSNAPETTETVTITDGIFNGYVCSYLADEVAVPAISITGGTYADNYAEIYAADDGYEFVANEDGTYGVVEIPEPEIFDISGVTMTLGSSLSLDFAVDTAKLTGTDNYAQMTIVYADGRESDTVIVPQSEWTQYNGTVYTAKFTGMAAKQMNDVVTAVIYNADGVAVSNPKSDSIETYAVRMLNGDAASNAKLRAVYVDMLNYGAAAQEQFDYDVENLANRNLTETHKAWATTTVETVDNRVKGTGYVGSTLTLAGEIQLDLVFANTAVGSDYSTLYAIATYTDHYGNDKEVRIEGADFIEYGTSHCQISITGMAVADFRSVVSCTVYNADGEALANAADSVESYANRNADSLGATVDTIVKFGESSYNYFH